VVNRPLAGGQERMSGKIAIVTGAAGGIGAATAELFCAAGARVVLADLNGEALEQTAGGIRARVPGAALEAVVCDVAEPSDAERVVRHAGKTFGGLNVLVSNAAIRNHAPVEQTSADDWHRLLSTNLVGAANFCRAAVGELRKDGHASVVIVSSCYAVVGRAGMPIYDATKAALLSLVKSFAWEEAEHNVRVNAVCPGGTITPYTLATARAHGKTEADLRAERKGNSLLGRRADALEIAYPIMWLASDEASYVTGATLMVDAGLSVM
jgi:2-hydroxycyclohexanecarboxyl-CoA dehydrogenase